jgi:hypothetical protein
MISPGLEVITGLLLVAIGIGHSFMSRSDLSDTPLRWVIPRSYRKRGAIVAALAMVTGILLSLIGVLRLIAIDTAT